MPEALASLGHIIRDRGGERMAVYRVGVVLTSCAILEVEAESAEEAQRKVASCTAHRVLVDRRPEWGGDQVAVLEVRDPTGQNRHHYMRDLQLGFGTKLEGRIEWSGGSSEPCADCLYCYWSKKFARFAEVDRRKQEVS
jgi:hypothetical protein